MRTSTDEKVCTSIFTASKYMEKLKQRLDMGWKLMVRNLKQVRQEHVAYFNKKARNRNLILGDKVLLSLQVTNKMKIAWQGSFSVVK